MSDLPSTEELQRLLYEATPGEWEVNNPGSPSLLPLIEAIESGRIVASVESEWCAPLIALAPDLAAEVIRLREEIEAMRADSLRAKIEFGSASLFDSFARHHHANIIHRLTRILEGDQA